MKTYKVRFVESLRDIHKGKDIWIIGPGPSLDGFPDDFFDDKISITLKWVCACFPHLFEKENEMGKVPYIYANFSNIDTIGMTKFIKEQPKILTKALINLRPREIAHWATGTNGFPVYVKERKEVEKDGFSKAVDNIMKKQSCHLVENGTIVHWTIQIAALLGAKKIILTGVDHKAINGREYSRKRGLDKIIRGIHRQFNIENLLDIYYAEWEGSYGPGVGWLAELFRNYGIDVCRFYYGRGFEKIPVETVNEFEYTGYMRMKKLEYEKNKKKR